MITRLHRFIATLDGLLHMPPCLDTVTSAGTAIGASLAATTFSYGDPQQVKNSNGNAKVWLVNFWAFNQVSGMARIRSPKMHDAVEGIRNRVVAGLIDPLMDLSTPQQLYPQDVPIVELAGSAVGGQIEPVTELLYYEDLLGQQQRLIDEPTLLQRMMHYVPVRLAITAGATAAYTGLKALNADSDLLQANTDYALIGFSLDARCGAITLRGPDTGNLRVSCPGEQNKLWLTQQWFVRLSRELKRALIPVIASPNKAATFVEVVSNQAGGTFNITVHLAMLSK